MNHPSFRSFTATRLACGLLGLVIGVSLLAPRDSAAQIKIKPLFTPRERLTDTTTGEVVRGKSESMFGTLNVIFVSSENFVTGDWKYFVLKPEAGPVLVAGPKIDCPDGLTAKIKS